MQCTCNRTSKDLNLSSFLLLLLDKILKKTKILTINAFYIKIKQIIPPKESLQKLLQKKILPKKSSQKNPSKKNPPKKILLKILPKNFSQKIPPKNFRQKNSSKKILQKNSQNYSKKISKNSKKIPKNF